MRCLRRVGGFEVAAMVLAVIDFRTGDFAADLTVTRVAGFFAAAFIARCDVRFCFAMTWFPAHGAIPNSGSRTRGKLSVVHRSCNSSGALRTIT
jgi:hypothetical protein